VFSKFLINEETCALKLGLDYFFYLNIILFKIWIFFIFKIYITKKEIRSEKL